MQRKQYSYADLSKPLNQPMEEKKHSYADLAQPLDPEWENKKLFNDLAKEHTGSYINPIKIIKAGLMGMGEAGKNIGELAAPLRKYVPESLKIAPDVNMKKIFGQENQNLLEKVASGIGQYSPLLAAGPLGLVTDVAAGAGYGATQSPESPAFGAAVGGGSNATFNLLNKLLGVNNPIVKAIARSAIGGAAGYALGGQTGAAEGAGAAFVAPHVAKKMGLGSKTHPGNEILDKVKPQEVLERLRAAHAIKTPITPGEAAGRPDVTAAEANLGRVGEAASERVKIGQERIKAQQEAIKELENRISPTEKIASFRVRQSAQDSIKKMEDARQEAVQPYYEKAYTLKIAPNIVKHIENKDANIRMAINEAMTNPMYQVEGELLNVPRNSIKTLDYAKRVIDSKIEQAKNFGDKDAVRVLNASKNKLLHYVDKISADYKKGRSIYNQLSKPIEDVENSQIGQIARMKDISLKNVSKNLFDPAQTDAAVMQRMKQYIQKEDPESWNHIIKNEMNRLMTQGKGKGITGRAFFDNVLANENRFNQFKIALSDNPKALEQLTNMRKAWEHLINIETPRTAAGQAKTSMSKARESVQAIVDMYNEMVGGEKQIKALNYIYSPKWGHDLMSISKLKNKDDKKIKLAMLLGKTIAPNYLLKGEE